MKTGESRDNRGNRRCRDHSRLPSTGTKLTVSGKRKSNANVTWAKEQVTALIESELRFTVCVVNGGYPASLELHTIYRVLPDVEAAREGDLRVVGESGEDYLYPSSMFVVVGLPHESGSLPSAGVLRRRFLAQKQSRC